MEPLVSVVVPVFNGLPHLRALTESLLAQTHTHLEIIFTEGGGTDASIDYLNSQSDPRIRVIQMPRGTSAAANWTAATMAACGEYTKLICQDDLLKPTAIGRQVADLEANPSAVMAIAQRDIVDARGKVLFAKRGLSGLSGPSGSLVPGSTVIRNCYLSGTNIVGEPLAVLFRTQDLKDAMPWEDSNPLMLDLSTYSKIAPHGDFVVRRESIGAFRVSANSWSTRIAREQVAQTRQWQEEFAAHASPPTTKVEHVKSVAGRRLQTTLRRAAYTYLRLKGSMTTQDESR
jgi:glycosyltransferase involved in cell wall biosynthesis